MVEAVSRRGLSARGDCPPDAKAKAARSKTLTYWPGRSKSDRLKLLLNSWHEIIVPRQGEFGYLSFEPPKSFTSLASLKPYEDMLDAIICCWIGACFFGGAAEPFGMLRSGYLALA